MQKRVHLTCKVLCPLALLRRTMVFLFVQWSEQQTVFNFKNSGLHNGVLTVHVYICLRKCPSTRGFR